MTDDEANASSPWLEDALRIIDRANAQDPRRVPNDRENDGESSADRNETSGEDGVGQEWSNGRRASHWLHELEPEASPALVLAVRAHHLERWLCPRDEFPRDRPGYLRWRKSAQRYHGTRLGELLKETPVPGAAIERAAELIQKTRDHDSSSAREAQAFEDALCLVFLERQLADFAQTVTEEKLRSILAKTLPKMSEHAIELVATLPLDPAHTTCLLELAAARP